MTQKVTYVQTAALPVHRDQLRAQRSLRDNFTLSKLIITVVSAGEIRILASPRMLSEATDASRPITVSDVLEVLRLHLTVAECDVFAYLSIESDIIVLVAPVTASPTPIQVSRLSPLY